MAFSILARSLAEVLLEAHMPMNALPCVTFTPCSASVGICGANLERFSEIRPSGTIFLLSSESTSLGDMMATGTCPPISMVLTSLAPLNGTTESLVPTSLDISRPRNSVMLPAPEEP
ncbi:hypothetical protein SDC9_112941 [bioreactor metagenome]|uniref:Uncharacterized protein n=1 Tax=bioreactor metagenome TaxID=1076179 RepID=A0A645BL61_9ZZZZ